MKFLFTTVLAVIAAAKTGLANPVKSLLPLESEEGGLKLAQSCQQEVACVVPGDVYITQLLSNVSYLFAWQASAYLPQYFEDPFTHFNNYAKTWERVEYNLPAMRATFEGRRYCFAGMDDQNIANHVALYYGKILTHQMFGFLKAPQPGSSAVVKVANTTVADILCDSLDHRRLESFIGSSDPIVQACNRAGRPLPWIYGVQQVNNTPSDSAFPIPNINGSFVLDLESYHNATSTLFAFQTLAGMQYAAQVINLCYPEDTWRPFNSSLTLRGEVVQDIMCTQSHRMNLITADDLLAEMIDNMSKMLAFQLFYASGSKAYLQYLCHTDSTGAMAHLDAQAMNGMIVDLDLVSEYILARCKKAHY